MSNPKPYGVNELREMFLSYFESKGHLRLSFLSLLINTLFAKMSYVPS